MMRKLADGGPIFNEELDDALFDYLQMERDAGHAASNQLLTEEVLRIAGNLNLGNFKASNTYVNRWKKRFGVTMHVSANDSQKAPADYKEAVDAFRSRIATLRMRFDYTANNICKVDQTILLQWTVQQLVPTTLRGKA